MNNVAAGIAGGLAVAVLGASALVFATRGDNSSDAKDQRVAEAPRTHTECSQVPVVTKNEWGTNGVIGTVLGGAAGGAIGHQFGGGHGKDAATAVGAVGGAMVGHNIANKNYPDQKVTYQERCREVAG